MGGVDPGPQAEPASILGIVRQPQDVRAKKEELAPYVAATSDAVSRSLHVPDDLRLGWQAFAEGFQKFYKDTSSYLTADTDYTTALRYQVQVAEWQAKLGQYLKLHLPSVPTVQDDAQVNPSFADKAAQASADWNATARTGLVVGGVAIGALGIWWLWHVSKVQSQSVELGQRVVEKMPPVTIF